ncbi:MAG TPA: HAMP domain-containing protein [Vicinamibacterales bacterium]|nr:HAMP domain-containing protein [Vicinamibacterales bacterium]
MAEKLGAEATVTFARKRVHEVLAGLEAMAAGDFEHKLPLSKAGDELDAIAHAINVIADELRITRKQV